MARTNYASFEKVAGAVRNALARGATVEIDGLGSFRKSGKGYHFHASDLPRVFIAYAHEDAAQAARIFDDLLNAGVEPWIDTRKLLPGQNWPRAIRNAMETADFIVCCFSRHSVNKRGGFQSEMRYAMEYARRLPLDDLYLLPVRLDECPMPVEIASERYYVNLYPDWNTGMARVIEAIHRETRHQRIA